MKHTYTLSITTQDEDEPKSELEAPDIQEALEEYLDEFVDPYSVSLVETTPKEAYPDG